MELYWKAAAGVLLAVVLMLALGRREMGLLLGMAACVMAVLAAGAYLEPVARLIRQVQKLGELDDGLLTVLLKAVGIGLVTEIAGMICADGGSGSMGKAVQLLGTAATLWLSIPLFTALLELIQRIMGGL